MREAANRDALAQIVPAIKVGQLGDDGFEREAVQRVAWLGCPRARGGFGWRWHGDAVVLHGLIVSAKLTCEIGGFSWGPSVPAPKTRPP